VVIQSYNHHIRLLPFRALVGLAITKFTRVEGADIVMKSMESYWLENR